MLAQLDAGDRLILVAVVLAGAVILGVLVLMGRADHERRRRRHRDDMGRRGLNTTYDDTGVLRRWPTRNPGHFTRRTGVRTFQHARRPDNGDRK